MNKNSTTPMLQEQERCNKNCCNTNTWWRILLKIFLGLAVLMLVFSLGAACVVKMKYVRFSNAMGYAGSSFGGMKHSPAFYENQNRDFLNTSVQSWKRIFGVISKVEGNKITLVNNAAEEVVVLSQAETIIISNTNEVGLSVLKAGLNVVVVYSQGEDGQNKAKTISIQ